MVALFWTTTQEHDYDWHTVASLYWKRYPNPNSKHVLSEDILSQQVDVNNGLLRVKRLVSKVNKIPWWTQKYFNAKVVWLTEEIIVDPKSKILTTYIRNINLAVWATTTEKVIYKPSEKNPGNTIAIKKVWIDSEKKYGLGRFIKRFSLNRYKKNCVKAAEGFNWVLKKGIEQ